MSGPKSDTRGELSVSSLSDRERQVLTYASNGLTDDLIARTLGISPGTVATYWSRVRMKFGPYGRTELVANFLRAGMNAEFVMLRDENERLIKQAEVVGFLREMNEALFVSSVRQNELVDQATETEATLRKLFEAAPMGIYACDAQGSIVQFNNQAVELWGKAPVDGVDKFCGSAKLWLPNGTAVPHEESPMVNVLRFGSPMLNVEMTLERPDGSQVPVLINFAPLKDQDQQITGAIASIFDLTQRKAFEDALGESEARFRLMAEVMPQKISMADRHGVLTYANPQLLEYTGLSFEQIRDEGRHRVIHSDDLAENTQRWNRSIETGEPFVDEYRLRRHDGQYRWHIGRAVPVTNDEGEIVSWIQSNTDVHDARSVEESMRTFLEDEVDLRTAELLATNEQLQGFTYSVAHDLRQQIRGISSNASLLILEASGELSQDSLEILNRLVGSSKKLAKIVDDLLTYARLGRHEPESVQLDLSALFEEVAAFLMEQGNFRADTRFLIAPGLIARGDVLLSRIVVENLLGNALKYSSKSEAPLIEVGREGEAFFVRDNGIGFEMQYEPKIFQPFERLHGDLAYPGTGIGLANVKRIVEKHGGKVWAEGHLGAGATFYFTLG